jgi:amino acid permease
MAFDVKTYVVQKFDHDGHPGDVLAVKLTFAAAHAIAKRYAPSKVLFSVADKDESPNVVQNGARYRTPFAT